MVRLSELLTRLVPLLSLGRISARLGTFRAFAFILCCFAVLLSAAMALHTPTALVAHYLLGRIVFSTSNGAIYFALGLFIVTMAVIVLVPAGKPHLKKKHLLLPLFLLGGNLLNLLSFFIYIRRINFPPGIHFYHWQGAFNSFGYLLHNHTGKTALAQLAGLFSLEDKLTAFDLGQVYLAHVPRQLTSTLSLVVVFSLVFYFVGLREIRSRYEDSFPVVLLYFLAFICCVKTVVDGGLLTYRFFPSLFVLAALFLSPSKERLWLLWKGRLGVTFLLVAAAMIGLWQFMAPAGVSSAIGPFIFLLMIYLWLLLLSNRSGFLLKRSMIAAVSLYLAGSVVGEFLLFDMSYFATIDSGYRVIHVDLSSFEAEDVTAQAQGMKVHEVYRLYGNHPLKPKNVLIAQTDAAGERKIDMVIKPLTYVGDSGGLPRQRLVRFSALDKVTSPVEGVLLSAEVSDDLPPVFSTTDATLFSRVNYYCYLHLMAGLLVSGGIEEFIMSPLTGRYAL